MYQTCRVVMVLLLPFAATAAQAQIAPESFRNKTYTYSFTEHEKARMDDTGESATFVISRHFTLFISSAGRLFGRQEVTARNIDQRIVGGGRAGGQRPGIHGVAERGPGASSQNLRALDDSFTTRKREFSGNKIRFFTQFSGVSRLMEIDVSGMSCTLDVKYGRESGGPKKRHTLSARPYTILDQTISAERCSVREGNHI